MSTNSMKKSELTSRIASACQNVDEPTATEAVKEILALMANELIHDGRIEIRGFGSFCLHHRAPRQARNPRTGESVQVGAKSVPHFKPGKALREMVNDSFLSA